MNKYITPLLASAALILTACNEEKDKNTNDYAAAPAAQTHSAVPATGSHLPAPVIASLDVQKILDSSTAAGEVRAEIDKKRSAIQAEMTKYETELRQKEQRLAEESKKLSEADFQIKREQFEGLIAEVQGKLGIRKLQLEEAFETARAEVYAAFLNASEDVKNEVGANIVLYKEQVVIADGAFDITDKVLSRLNDRLPKVKVTYKTEAEIKKMIEAQQKA